jgi:hypothetical protein
MVPDSVDLIIMRGLILAVSEFWRGVDSGVSNHFRSWL